ncbi:hypothetical protein B4122_0223 [Bacillus subtilis]|uniref:Uncharacterized protein n=1 Tax=Bacillus subtilis TaxID=1423 RepID=A0AAP1EA41_BACIU|nr:hypothetical protein B4122_0223 [Bacillus subtilis]
MNTPHRVCRKGHVIGIHNSAHRYLNKAWRAKECKDYFIND